LNLGNYFHFNVLISTKCLHFMILKSYKGLHNKSFENERLVFFIINVNKIINNINKLYLKSCKKICIKCQYMWFLGLATPFWCGGLVWLDYCYVSCSLQNIINGIKIDLLLCLTFLFYFLVKLFQNFNMEMF